MKAIVFDMDGTLLDSMPAWNRVNEQIVEDFHIPMDQLDYDLVITQGFGSLVKILRKYYDLEVDVADLHRRSNELMEKWYGAHAVTRPGVVENLKALRKGGYPLAVATATEEGLARLALQTAGISDHFDLIYSSSTDEFPKNDRHYWETVAKRMDCDPSQMILFDDALYALVTAGECGYFTVGLEDPSYQQDLDQMKRRADAFLPGFEGVDLLAWLKDQEERSQQ